MDLKPIRPIQGLTRFDRDDYTHPEKLYRGLWTGDIPPPRPDGYRVINYMQMPHDENGMINEELCWVCGWTAFAETHSSYASRLRIVYSRSNVGIWEVGTRWMISDRPNDATLGNDFITQEFLRKQPNHRIPLIQEMRKLNAPTDKVDLTLMSRVPGKPLVNIWGTLNHRQRASYTRQVANLIKQWRQFTSPVAQRVDGGLLDDQIFQCQRVIAPACRKVGRTVDEWFKNMEEDLRFGLVLVHRTKDPLVIEEKYQELKRNFPKCEPYVLTHGDLNLANIIVEDGKIQAVIDWERAGYLPWWAERDMSLTTCGEFFEPLWRYLDKDTNDGISFKEVAKGIGPVAYAIDRALLHIDHPDMFSGWNRPPFCKCKPYVGFIKMHNIGVHPPKHKPREDAIDEYLAGF